MGKPFGVTGE